MKVLCLLLLNILICSCTVAETNAILASVNGQPITVLDVVLETGRREARAARFFSGDALEQEVKRLRTKALESIITRKLIYAEYKKQPFEIPKQYIENAMDALSNTFGGGDREALRVAAQRYGMTLDQLREKAHEKVAVEILVNEYCRRPCFVTPKQVFEYYKNHKELFVEPREFELFLIQIKYGGRYKDRFEEIVNECTEKIDGISLEDFRAMAMVYSEDRTAENGGCIDWVKQDDMRTEFYNALNVLDVGKTVKIDISNEAVYFFYLNDVRGGVQRPFKVVCQEVKNRLMREQRQKKFDAYIDKLKRSAVIRMY